MKQIRVLVVDDHVLFRKGVTGLLRPSEGFTVVGEAKDGREAVAKAQASAPDVVLMDIYMHGVDGLEATRRIKAALPSTRIIMLTVSEREDDVIAAMEAVLRR